jgi:hypothetical protein
MEHIIGRCIVMLIYLVKEHTAKESLQALLDAGRHSGVEGDAQIAKFVFKPMSFSTTRLKD